MPRTIGRRARFFAFLALIGLLMVYPTPPAYRGAAWFVFGLSMFWALLFAIEDLATPTYRRAKAPSPVSENPFAPPPPPGKAVAAGPRDP